MLTRSQRKLQDCQRGVKPCASAVAAPRKSRKQPKSAPAQPWWLLDLPDKCVNHVVELLPANEVACNVRLVTKRAARSFNKPEHKTVKVNTKTDIVPSYAITARWGASGAARALTLKQRRALRCCMARNGSDASSLTTFAKALGCTIDAEVLTAAARAGHADLCSELLDEVEDLQPALEEDEYSSRVVAAAAAGGHLEAVKQLVDAGLSVIVTGNGPEHDPMAAAAIGGHRHVCEWMLDNGWESDSCVNDLAREGHWAAAQYVMDLTQASCKRLEVSQFAYGCSLRALKAVCAGAVASGGSSSSSGSNTDVGGIELTAAQQQQARARVQQLDAFSKALLLHCAAASPTPDWQAKVEWVLEQGVAPDLSTCCVGFLRKCADLPARVQWLQGRGVGVDGGILSCWMQISATSKDLPLFRQLLGEGCRAGPTCVRGLAQRGELELLKAVAEAVAAEGGAVGEEWWKDVALYAARGGHLHVLRWAVGEEEQEEGGRAAAAAAAGRSRPRGSSSRSSSRGRGGGGGGQREARGRGGEQGGGTAGDVGERARELLTGEVFDHVLRSGNVEAVRWMRAQGCEWPHGALVTAAAHCSEELVEWMVTEGGCPGEVSGPRRHAGFITLCLSPLLQ